MEKAIFSGYRYFKFTDPVSKSTHEGYTLYLLEEIKDKDNQHEGFMPLTFYDRYNNRQKYPSISTEEFDKFKIGQLQFPMDVEVVFDRRNHLIELR